MEYSYSRFVLGLSRTKVIKRREYCNDPGFHPGLPGMPKGYFGNLVGPSGPFMSFPVAKIIGWIYVGFWKDLWFGLSKV